VERFTSGVGASTSALGNRVFRRLFAAQLAALAGTGLATVALGLLAFDLAGAGAGRVLGTVFAIKMVAYVLVAPVAQALVTRLPSRAVLIVADLVRAAVAIMLPFTDALWQIYLLVFMLQAASAVHTPTFQGAIPDVLPDERQYTQALSITRLAEDLEMVLSPLLAAVILLALPQDALFWGTALGLLASALLLSSITMPRRVAIFADGGDGADGNYGNDRNRDNDGNVNRADDDATQTQAQTQAFSELPLGARVRHGMRLMWQTKALRPVIALNLTVAAAGAFVLVQTVVIVRDTFGQSNNLVALMLAVNGAGSMLAALTLPKSLARFSERHIMLGGAVVMTAATLLVPLALQNRAPLAGLAAIGLLWLAVGFGWASTEVPFGRLVIREVPDTERPAVFAAEFSLSHLCWLLTYPIAGWLGAVSLSQAALLLALFAAVATIIGTRLWPAREPKPLLT